MRRLVATLLLAAASACAARDDYRAYRAAHPGWEPAFPKGELSLEELFALLHAPTGARNTTLNVTHLRVLGLGTDPWESVPLDRIRAGGFAPDPGRLYVVVARTECTWATLRTGDRGDDYRNWQAYPWYLFRDGRLLAYQHVTFGERCEPDELEKGTVHQIPAFRERLREVLMNRDDP